MRTIMTKAFITDPPPVTADNLRDYLANDKLFMDYLNTFLSLPIFPVAYHYCNQRGLFRISAESDRDSLRANETHSKRPSIMNARRHSFQPIPLLSMENSMKYQQKKKAKHHISVLVLNKRKGLQWIQTERLSHFLESRLYAEYRLAKILSQSRLIRHDKTNIPDLYLTFVPLEEPARAISSPVGEDAIGSASETKTESVVISFGDASQKEIDTWNHNVQTLNQVGYNNDLMDMSDISLCDLEDGSSPHKTISCVMFANMDALRPEIGPATYVVPCSKPKDETRRKKSVKMQSTEKAKEPLRVNNMKELSLMLIAAVIKSAIVEVEGVTEQQVEESVTFKRLFPFCQKWGCKMTMALFKNPIVFDQHVDKTSDILVLKDLSGYKAFSGNDTSLLLCLDGQKDHFSFPFMDDEKKDQLFVSGMCAEDQKEQSQDDDPVKPDNKVNASFSTNANIKEFQALLKEKSCEKNWFLWIDLDKFRQSKTDVSKEISVMTIKNKYYNTTPRFELSLDLKNEIDINDWKSLSDEKVAAIQRTILEPIFEYWMPLYLLKKQIQADPSKYRNYFTLKKVRINATRFCTPERASDVSIFVLKPSKTGERKKMSEEQNKVGPFDVLPLPPTYPNIGNRRTYLISALQNDSIAKHYHWNRSEQKRHSIPSTKKIAQERNLNFSLPDDQDIIKPIRKRRPSVAASSQETWPNSRVNIELIDRKFEVGMRFLPRELSCTKILKSLSRTCVNQSAACKDQYSEAEWREEKKYKLLSSLFNALKSERASGDIFGAYLRDKNLEAPTYCLMLWDAISKFLYLFYHQPMVWSKVIRQVRLIHSEYLSAGARLNVECNPDITHEIQNNLNDPTGDMFKTVAEHILAVLLPSWKQFCNEEKQKAADLQEDA